MQQILRLATSAHGHRKGQKKVHRGKGKEGYKRKGPKLEGDIEMADVQPVWELDDEEEEFNEFALIGEEDDEPEDIQEQAKTRFEALARIVSWIPLFWPCIVAVTVDVVSRNKCYASVL